MYDFFRGDVVRRDPTAVVLDVGGVGYRFSIPLTSYDAVPAKGPARLFAHLHVREDELRLFGFATVEERKLFELLLTVGGIGPTVAIGVTSAIPLDRFRDLVVAEDVGGLTRLKGIGKKIAQRIVLELGDVMRALPIGDPELGRPLPAAGAGAAFEDALLALMALGYTRIASEKALRRAVKETGDDADVGDLVRAALTFAG